MSVAGQLTPDDDAALRRLEPHLRELFGREGDWEQILSAELAFTEETRCTVRASWETEGDQQDWVQRTADRLISTDGSAD